MSDKYPHLLRANAIKRGEHLEHEIADFPKLGKRMIRNGTAIDIYNIADGEPFGDA